MNKKYSYGNEFITDSFSLCNYEINLNNTNNRLNYSFQLFPYSNSLFKTNIIFENLIINNYKYDFYYSFVYSNYKYIIYNCKNDYEELELSYEDEDYDVYESNNYILTDYYNLIDNTRYVLFDKKLFITYEFYSNVNYPYRISFGNENVYSLSYNQDNTINKISRSNEEIIFSYNNSITEITLYKKDDYHSIICAKTIINLINDNDTSITYYLYNYSDTNHSYVQKEIKRLDIIKHPTTLKILDNTNDYYVKFYMTNNKITQIDNCNGEYNNNDNIFTTTISYSSNITTVSYDNKNYKVIYDNNNMKKYIIYDSKYIKYYEYNNDFLLSYESDYINNKSLIENELSSFYITTYEPIDEYDEDDYSFDIEEVYNQTLPSEFNNFITSNDIYHIEGYGELEYYIYDYGDEFDAISMFFLYKIISGYFYAEIVYYDTEYNHTSKIKMLSYDSNNINYMPFIMGIKPRYSYTKIKIRLSIDGEIYINTPKINKLMGTYYLYNNNYNVSSVSNISGTTNYTYDNNRIINISSPESTINYTRDIYGNITVENRDGYIITKTYDSKNRITSITNPNSSYNYSYEEEIDNDNIYEYRIIITDNNYSKTIINTYDNNGNLIGRGKPVTNSGVTTYDYDLLYYYSYNLLNKIDDNDDISTFTYDNQNRLINIYDNDSNNNYNIRYNFSYSNGNISNVKYYGNSNNYKNISIKTYDNKDRVISNTFKGTYNYIYSDVDRIIMINYNNSLKYVIHYNEYDLITSDIYNNYIYDIDGSLKENEINDITFKYRNNSICFKDINNNYFYESNNYGYNELKNDPYYANITYNSNTNVGIINSSISVFNKTIGSFYPLESNYLSIDGDKPKYFRRQDYKSFYYDKDINNYAALFYGARIAYDTNIKNSGRIRFDIKLENRTLDQLIIKITSLHKNLEIYRNTTKYLKIIWNGVETTDNLIESNKWYTFDVLFDNYSLYIKYKRLEDLNWISSIHKDNIIYQNDTNIEIELGRLVYYYNPKITFGLIRNLNVINSAVVYSDDINYVSKSNTFDKTNNLLINEEVRYNNNVVYSKNNITSIDTTNHIIEYESTIDNSLSFSKKMSNNICIESNDLITDDLNILDITHYYLYDDKGQLTKEIIGNYTYEYTYDDCHNITSYVKKDGNIIELSKKFIYNQTYKTRLDSITIVEDEITSNYQITYDNETGLLISSFNDDNYLYEGKRLIKYGDFCNYKYNVYGRRTRKYSDNNYINIYYYYDNNNNLIYEDRGTYQLKYIYDSKNELYGFYYIFVENNDTKVNTYFYIKNELGIIVAIMDINKDIIGRYEYDSYGYIEDIIQNDNDTYDIINKNPIRYKSYYYDTESDMYYLNNRYYHPLLARFITPDSYEYIDINNNKSFNLYAYCYNDPINYADPEGNYGIITALVVGALIGAAVGGIISATISDLNNIPYLDASISNDGCSVHIENSYRIKTPWVQYIYAFYLNHINSKTKNNIKGTTAGVQAEWMVHNIAYYGLTIFDKMGFNVEKYMDQSMSVDVGFTIFSDNHSDLSKSMFYLYSMFYPTSSTIDSLISLFLKLKNGGL